MDNDRGSTEMRDLNRTWFMDLMERFCPQWKFVRGPLGGENWSKNGEFWSSYTRLGVAEDLIYVMANHIETLEQAKR